MAGLSLRALTLLHFRSHHRADLALDGRPVALFGANGAGKTNLIEAVSLLSPGRGLRRASTAELSRRPEGLGWKVRAEVQRGDLPHEIETGAELNESRFVRIDGKKQPQLALASIVPVVWLVPAMDRLWIEAAEGRRRFLDRLAMSFVPEHAGLALDYEKAMRERNRLLKEGVRDAHWYGAIEKHMARAGAALTRNRQTTIARLMLAQEGATSAFPTAELTLLESAECENEEGLLEAFKASRGRDLATGRTMVGPHRADLGAVWQRKAAKAADCSTGEQKALLVSLVLANARALAADTGLAPLLLLDEVAAHLDKDRRAALYDEISALEGQVFMTGTEETLFAGLGARAQAFHISEEAGVSEVELA